MKLSEILFRSSLCKSDTDESFNPQRVNTSFAKGLDTPSKELMNTADALVLSSTLALSKSFLSVSFKSNESS